MEQLQCGSPAKATDADTPKEEASSEGGKKQAKSDNLTQETVIKEEIDAMDHVDNIITGSMLKEEEQLHENTVKDAETYEDEKEKSLKDITDEIKEQRYKRLQFLLSKSNLYTEYLLKRMEANIAETEKKEKKQVLKGKTNEHISKEEGSESKVKQSEESGKEKGSEVKTKRGRKRKAQQENKYEISDYFEEAAARCKRQKLQENNSEKGSDKAVKVEKKEGEQRILNGETIDPDQPKLLSGGVLRPYQMDGFRWLKVLYENGVNGILADEMGLGKTIQCISIVSHLVENGIPGPFLVVAPLSTIPNWLSEFKRFAPKVPVVLYHGSIDEREKLRRQISKYHLVSGDNHVRPVVITSYEIAMNDRSKINMHEWRYIIVDEGHRIKNYKCRLIRELKMYRSTHRLLLTGTPLQNNLSELWSLLNFLLPEIFDDLGSFESWFDIDALDSAESQEQIVVQEQKNQVLSMLHQILTPFLLRRLKSDVELLIPPKREILVYAPLTKTQQDYYKHTVEKTIAGWIDSRNGPKETCEYNEKGRPVRRKSKKVDYSIMLEEEKEYQDKKEEEEDIEKWVSAIIKNGESEDKSLDGKKKTAFLSVKMQNIMMQLRKCCNHPYLIEHPLDMKTGELLLDTKVHMKAGKLLLLDRMLPELKKRKHKVLIFSQMTRMLNILEDYLSVKNYSYCRLDGSMKWEDRKNQMEQYNTDPDMFVFLLSTRAGGLGINLTAADTVIIYDSDWNPQSDLQAQDRCHRIGQTKPVLVYRLVTANTVDQKVVERAAAKRRLEKLVIHKGKFKTGIKSFSKSLAAVTPEELMELLRSTDFDAEMGDKAQNSVISDRDLRSLLDRSDLADKWEKLKQGKQCDSQSELDESDVEAMIENKGKLAFRIIDEEIGKTGLETDINSNNLKENKQTVKTVADIIVTAYN